MKFKSHRRGGVLAATIAVAATLGGAAPAQAQEDEWTICVKVCKTIPLCVGSVCVSGVPENVEAIRSIVAGVIADVKDAVPEEVCTPPLPSYPICVST